MESTEKPIESVGQFLSSVSDVTQALKQLSQWVTASEKEINRLTRSEEHNIEQIRLLSERVRDAERRAFDQAEESRRLTVREKDLTGQVKDLTRRLEERDSDLQRRLNEATDRADLYEERTNELKEKAELGERLAFAGSKLAGAIDRLPTSLKDVTLMRAEDQEIQLYNTYEWQAVADAAILLRGSLGEPPSDKES